MLRNFATLYLLSTTFYRMARRLEQWHSYVVDDRQTDRQTDSGGLLMPIGPFGYVTIKIDTGVSVMLVGKVNHIT